VPFPEMLSRLCCCRRRVPGWRAPHARLSSFGLRTGDMFVDVFAEGVEIEQHGKSHCVRVQLEAACGNLRAVREQDRGWDVLHQGSLGLLYIVGSARNARDAEYKRAVFRTQLFQC